MVEQAGAQAAPWALVAGASGGVGGAIARRLADDGWNLHLTYHTNVDAVGDVAESVRASGREALVHRVDLTDHVATRAVVAAAAERPLSGVVYAAGPHIPMRYIAAQDPADFAHVIDSDLKACYNLLQPALRPLRETEGAILAVTTPAIDRYPKRDVLSAAPKAGVQAVVRGIAVEEGRYGVRANCVSVGLLEGAGMWNELVARGDYTEEMFAVVKREIPMRRFGDVTDIGEAAAFLMSPRAGWITGQTLRVDGGYSV